MVDLAKMLRLKQRRIKKASVRSKTNKVRVRKHGKPRK